MAQLIASMRTLDGTQAITEFDFGSPGLVDLWIYDGGVPADPTAQPNFRYRAPDGTVSTSNLLTKVAGGHYQLTLAQLNPAGTYKATIVCGVPHSGSVDLTWTVRERAVP